METRLAEVEAELATKTQSLEDQVHLSFPPPKVGRPLTPLPKKNKLDTVYQSYRLKLYSRVVISLRLHPPKLSLHIPR